MPIDPSIIGQLRTPEPIDPMRQAMSLANFRTQMESAAALQEQRRALADQRRQAIEAKDAEAASRKAAADAIAQIKDGNDEAVLSQLDPDTRLVASEWLVKYRTNQDALAKLRDQDRKERAQLIRRLGYNAVVAEVMFGLDDDPQAGQIFEQVRGDEAQFRQLIDHYATLGDQPPRTREIKTKNANGSETIQIVDDKPGQNFTSAAEPQKPPEAGTLADYMETFARNMGRTVAQLSPFDKRKARAEWEAAGRAPEVDRSRQDDPTLPRGVEAYLVSLRAKHSTFGSAASELDRAMRDLRRDHPSLSPGKAMDALKRQYSRQYFGGLEDLIAGAMAEEGGDVTAAGSAPQAPAPPPSGGRDARSLEERARDVLMEKGLDSSPASVERFLSNPKNRTALHRSGSR